MEPRVIWSGTFGQHGAVGLHHVRVVRCPAEGFVVERRGVDAMGAQRWMDAEAELWTTSAREVGMRWGEGDTVSREGACSS